MRCLNRNKKTIYYKTYSSITAIVDSNGDPTGEYTTTYGALKKTQMNVSASSGIASEEIFGIATNYAKVLITDDLSCDMDENSIVWIDAATTGSHNYVVVRKAKSLNSVAYGLSEVDVNG